MLRIPAFISLLFFAINITAQEQNGSPGKRVDAKMFYHNRLKQVVMMDGTPPYISQPATTALWTWTGDQWQKLKTRELQQPARYASGAVYDTRRNKIISFGGRVGETEQILNDTWEWDEHTWEKSSDTLVQARDHLALSYDEARGNTILFGGGIFPRIPGPWATDTWQWDGVKWKQVATTGPAGRVTAMTYDVARKQVVLFGGVGAPDNGHQPRFSDTWTWNGMQWKKMSAGGPMARSRHALAYDTKNEKVILYGGESDNGALSDMWEWNGVVWKEIKFEGPSPGDRYVHSMAYDEHRAVLVLFGGMHKKELMSDTWEWDGKNWRVIE